MLEPSKFPPAPCCFFGHSGQGKSTLSTSFGKAGFPVITDDVLVLQESRNEFNARPSLPWVRLCRESVDAVFGSSALDHLSADDDGKLRVDPASGLMPFATGPTPVRGIFVLAQGDPLPSYQDVEITRIAPAQAVGILLSRDSMLPILEQNLVAQVLGALTRLVKQVPVWQLVVNPGLERLPRVVSAVLAHQESQFALSSSSCQEQR